MRSGENHKERARSPNWGERREIKLGTLDGIKFCPFLFSPFASFRAKSSRRGVTLFSLGVFRANSSNLEKNELRPASHFHRCSNASEKREITRGRISDSDFESQRDAG